MCVHLQHSLLECELKNVQERLNKEHTGYSQIRSHSHQRSVAHGFKIWGHTNSYTATTTIESNWKFSDSTTLHTLR